MYSVVAFLARHRVAVIAVFGVMAPIFYLHWTQTKQIWPWFCFFAISMILLILSALVPARYEKLRLIGVILPTIHQVLGLNDNERVTVHHIKSWRRERYEQLLNYYPGKYGGRGRIFSFSHGIAGECFKKMESQCYSIPPGVTFEDAMRNRWNFGADELQRLTKDRRSFCVIPIAKAESRAKAVLYLDSPDAQRFAEADFDPIRMKVESLFLPLLQELLKD